jgi:hypothetical protein
MRGLWQSPTRNVEKMMGPLLDCSISDEWQWEGVPRLAAALAVEPLFR